MEHKILTLNWGADQYKHVVAILNPYDSNEGLGCSLVAFDDWDELAEVGLESHDWLPLAGSFIGDVAYADNDSTTPIVLLK